MNEELYGKINEFFKKYPLTIGFRISKHLKVMSKHLNPGEEVIYIFPAQITPGSMFSTCLIAFTNKRILVAQKHVFPGYYLNSITPDLFNDFQVNKGWIWGRVNIDTAKEIVNLSYIDSRALVEIETNLSEYLLNVKPKFKKTS